MCLEHTVTPLGTGPSASGASGREYTLSRKGMGRLARWGRNLTASVALAGAGLAATIPAAGQQDLDQVAVEYGLTPEQARFALEAAREVVGENALAPKAQSALSSSEVAALQEPLEKVAMRSWIDLVKDTFRPWHLSVVYTPTGLDVYAVMHQWDNLGNTTRPERYLSMTMGALGSRAFNLDPTRAATPVAGFTRINQESQPLAGAHPAGTPLTHPLADLNIIQYFMNPSEKLGIPGFYEGDVIADPGLLFKLFSVNSLVESAVVAGGSAGGTKPGRTIPTEFLGHPAGYEKLSPEDFAVLHVLQRVMGARLGAGTPSNFQVYPARMAISRGADGVDAQGRTEYLVTAWPVHPVSKESDYGYMQANVRVGWNSQTLKLEGGAPMAIVANTLTNGVFGGDIYARTPPAGQTFDIFSNNYAVVGSLTPSNGIPWDAILPPGYALRTLKLPE